MRLDRGRSSFDELKLPDETSIRPTNLSTEEIYVPPDDVLTEYCEKFGLESQLPFIKDAIREVVELYNIVEDSARTIREKLRDMGINSVFDFLKAFNLPNLERWLRADEYPILCIWVYNLLGNVFGHTELYPQKNGLLNGAEMEPHYYKPRTLFHVTSSITVENLLAEKQALIPHYAQAPEVVSHLGRAAKVLISFFSFLGKEIDKDFRYWIFFGTKADPDDIRFIEKLGKEFGSLKKIEERILKIFFKDLKTLELSDCMKEVFTQLLLQQPVKDTTINQLMDDLYNYCHVRGPRAKNIREVLSGNIKLTREELHEISDLGSVEADFIRCLFSYSEDLDYHENDKIFPVILEFDQRQIEISNSVANFSISIVDIRSPDVFFAAASAPVNSLVAIYVPDEELSECKAKYQNEYPSLRILPLSAVPPQMLLNSSLQKNEVNDPHCPACVTRYEQRDSVICVRQMMQGGIMAPLTTTILGHKYSNPFVEAFHLEKFDWSYPIVWAQSLKYTLSDWYNELSPKQKNAVDKLINDVLNAFPGVFGQNEFFPRTT